MSPAPFITRKEEIQQVRGDWAAKLRAVGTVLDKHDSAFREVCILEVDHGFVVQAFEQAKHSDAWKPASLEIQTDEIAIDRPARPTR